MPSVAWTRTLTSTCLTSPGQQRPTTTTIQPSVTSASHNHRSGYLMLLQHLRREIAAAIPLRLRTLCVSTHCVLRRSSQSSGFVCLSQRACASERSDSRRGKGCAFGFCVCVWLDLARRKTLPTEHPPMGPQSTAHYIRSGSGRLKRESEAKARTVLHVHRSPYTHSHRSK